jgi:hypothetical protein
VDEHLLGNDLLHLSPGEGSEIPRTLDMALLESITSESYPFDRVPLDWAPEDEKNWTIVDGYLRGEAPGDAPEILWFKNAVQGNHAIRYRGSALIPDGASPQHVSQHGDLNCIWNSNVRDTNDPTYSLCVSGFGGWYSGMSGIEYAVGAESKIPGAYAVSHILRLIPGREYEIFGGRFGQTDFLFVDRQLVMEVDSRLPRRDENYVAVSTFGDDTFPAIIRVSEVEVYHIPDDAMQRDASKA